MAKTMKKAAYSDEKKAADLANALQTLPDTWIECRDMRHAWTVMNDFHVSAGQGRKVAEIRRELVCLRCETVRRETYHQTRFGLEKVAQSYGYVEGYEMKGVPRGVKPQAIIHDEMYRRSMDKIAKSQKGA
jgi:hypothetical protein